MKTSNSGIGIIKYYESLHDGDLSLIGLQPKIDPVGIWTEGYGHAIINPITGKFIKGENNKGLALCYSFISNPDIDDETEAEILLKLDLRKVEDQVNSLGIKFNQNQFDALVSFIFNLGIGNFKESTLWKYIKSNSRDPKICQAFCMWIKMNGKPALGLARRRTSEANLYLK